jgi:hypothetical protein
MAINAFFATCAAVFRFSAAVGANSTTLCLKCSHVSAWEWRSELIGGRIGTEIGSRSDIGRRFEVRQGDVVLWLHGCGGCRRPCVVVDCQVVGAILCRTGCHGWEWELKCSLVSASAIGRNSKKEQWTQIPREWHNAQQRICFNMGRDRPVASLIWATESCRYTSLSRQLQVLHTRSTRPQDTPNKGTCRQTLEGSCLFQVAYYRHPL